MKPFWHSWAKPGVAPVEVVAKRLGVSAGVAVRLCEIETRQSGIRDWMDHRIVKLASDVAFQNVRAVRVKSPQEYQDLRLLWIRAGLYRALTDDMMWAGVRILPNQ